MKGYSFYTNTPFHSCSWSRGRRSLRGEEMCVSSPEAGLRQSCFQQCAVLAGSDAWLPPAPGVTRKPKGENNHTSDHNQDLCGVVMVDYSPLP